MSWLFKSLQSPNPPSPSPPQSPTAAPAPVLDDFSLIGESFGRQLRGVANFLAPPPSPPSQASSQSLSHRTHDSSPSQTLLGIRNDLAEIGGSLKSGLLLLSGNRTVSEISKFTSSFLPFQTSMRDDEEEDDDDDHGYVPGITQEVVDFVTEISTRPECWTDFPLSLPEDFRISDAQREHAFSILHVVPTLSPLRDNLLNHMGDEQFWMVYFILLLPRLSEHDSEILVTPQIVETRNLLLQNLQKKRNLTVGSPEKSDTADTSEEGSKVLASQEQSPYTVEKLTEIVDATKDLEIGEENTDRGLEDTDINMSTSFGKQKNLEDDVSFSDLEDDDNDLSTRLLSASGKTQGISAPSPSGSSDWVQLHESSESQGGLSKPGPSVSRDKDSDGESNDWLKVDDFD